MQDVYSKDGKPDRLVTTEAERTAAVFEGFKPAKKAEPLDPPKTDDKKPVDPPKTEAPKPGPKTN